jgi:capsular polysaccharide transport system ATP-binding protein
MHAPFGSRLIHLVSVSKSFGGNGCIPKVVFRPTTVALPADRRLCILGQRRQGKTVFLRMLARSEAPDVGEVIAPWRLSPAINSGGLLHSQLTGLQNIRFIARTFGLSSDYLTMAVAELCGAGDLLGPPLKNQEPARRKAIELALFSMLPFDCYLVDDIGQFAADVVARCFDAIARRRAGVIFTTSGAGLARHFADCAVVIRQATLHPFTRVEEAAWFYER